MTAGKSWWRTCLQSVVVGAAIIASPMAAAVDENYRAIVAGGNEKGVEHLKAFNEALKKIVGQSNLSEAYIECANCNELEELKPTVKKLTYYFLRARPDSSLAMLMAWQEVQRSMFSPTFTLEFDGQPADGGNCGNPPYVSPPCASRPFCQSMGGCSKQANPLPCKKCDLAR